MGTWLSYFWLNLYNSWFLISSLKNFINTFYIMQIYFPSFPKMFSNSDFNSQNFSNTYYSPSLLCRVTCPTKVSLKEDLFTLWNSLSYEDGVVPLDVMLTQQKIWYISKRSLGKNRGCVKRNIIYLWGGKAIFYLYLLLFFNTDLTFTFTCLVDNMGMTHDIMRRKKTRVAKNAPPHPPSNLPPNVIVAARRVTMVGDKALGRYNWPMKENKISYIFLQGLNSQGFFLLRTRKGSSLRLWWQCDILCFFRIFYIILKC